MQAVSSMPTICGVIFAVILFFAIPRSGTKKASDLDDVYNSIRELNGKLLPMRNAQNARLHMTNPANSGMPSMVKLDALIKENHLRILGEVQEVFRRGYRAYPVAKIDDRQWELTQGKEEWGSIWVRFVGEWAGTADLLPTLKSIVKEVGDDIILLHVSIFKPGTVLPPHYGISMGVWRYHYGLSIPEGDLGMVIGGKKFKWEPCQSMMFDDTIYHEAWNRTDKLRCVILADVVRECEVKDQIIDFHKKLQRYESISSITERLRKEGIGIG